MYNNYSTANWIIAKLTKRAENFIEQQYIAVTVVYVDLHGCVFFLPGGTDVYIAKVQYGNARTAEGISLTHFYFISVPLHCTCARLPQYSWLS